MYDVEVKKVVIDGFSENERKYRVTELEYIDGIIGPSGVVRPRIEMI